MSEKIINVLYTFDTRFWKLAAVSIYSLLKNKNANTKCVIHCMVPARTRGHRKIKNIVRGFNGAELIWRRVKKSQNPFRTYDFQRWSPVIFYRLFAGQIFPNVEKMLYLDSDTLICDDLGELFDTDISQYTMAAVQDMAPRDDPTNKNGKYVQEFAQKYLKNGPYFNSGVLLINSKKLTENEMLLKNTKVDLKYPDQDLLNAALINKIKPLHPQYNYVPGLPIPKHFDKIQADTAKQHPKILHFYAAKPYHYSYVPRETYSLFYKTSTEINIHPDDMIKHELKYIKKNTTKASHIGPLKISDSKISLFGITIIKL